MLNKTTLALLTLLLAAPSVNAAGVDCKRPLSEPGYKTLASNWYYTHDKGNAAAIDAGMSRACEAGKEWRTDGLPLKEADARFEKLAWQWLDGVVGNQVEDKQTRGEIAHSIYTAGLSGFIDELQPPYNLAASKEVDDLFRDFESRTNAPKSGARQLNKAASKGDDLSRYVSQMQAAIAHNMDNWESYKGKACTVRLNLSRDALLLGAKSESGDPAFCQAILARLKTVNFPKFPNDDLYDVFKNAALDFRP